MSRCPWIRRPLHPPHEETHSGCRRRRETPPRAPIAAHVRRFRGGPGGHGRRRIEAGRPRRHGADRSEAAAHGRAGIPGADPPPERAGARGHDDGVRQRGNGGGSHEGRRHRFPAQAVFPRPPDAGGPQGAGGARAARRESPAQGGAGTALRVRQYHRAKRGHAGDFRRHRARGPDARHRAVDRRKRRGQGSDRARHPLSLAAQAPPAGQDQLLRPAGESDGERALRL